MAKERIVIEFNTLNPKDRRIYRTIKSIKNHSNKKSFSKAFIKFFDEIVTTLIEQEEALESCETKNAECQQLIKNFTGRNIDWVKKVAFQRTHSRRKDH